MMSSVGTLGNVTAFQSAAVRPRRVIRSGSRPVAAVPDYRGHVVQQAGKTLLAAAAAVTLSISAGPASAGVPTFGIQKSVEKAESSYEAALARLDSIFEASQKEASKASTAVASAADSVAGAATKLASATSPDGQKNSVPNATQQGGKAAQPADLKEEGLNAPNPSAAVKKASEEVKSSSADTAQQINQQVSKYQEKAKDAQDTPNSVGSVVDKAASAVSGDDDNKGGIGGFFSQFTKGPKEAATDAIGAAASSAVVDAGKNLPSGAVEKVAEKAGDKATSTVNSFVDQFK